MGRSRGRLACAVAALLAGCSSDTAPSIAACAEILAARAPSARVVATVSDSVTEAALDFEVGSWWKEAARGRLACSFEEQPAGGLRLRAAVLDGQPFTSAEVTVVNADLLLADMRRAAETGDAPPISPPR